MSWHQLILGPLVLLRCVSVACLVAAYASMPQRVFCATWSSDAEQPKFMIVLRPCNNTADFCCRLNKAVVSRMSSAELPTIAHHNAAKLHAQHGSMPAPHAAVSMEQD